jgi:hypothetical protein
VSGNAPREPLASWDCGGGSWLAASGMSDDLFGQSEPFSGRWPTSGTTLGGRLYPLPTSGHLTGGSGSSSVRGLLPTPLVTNRAGMEPSPATLAGTRGSDLGPVIGELLKTPTAQLAVNGGSQPPGKRRAGGHGPTLADQVEHDLLPTPTARLGDDSSRSADPARYKGPKSLNGRRSNLDDCIAAVETGAPWLLPTPAAGSFNDGESLESWESRRDRLKATGVNGNGMGTPLAIAVQQLFPTPGATDWKGSGATQGRDRDGRPRPAGDADLSEAVSLLPTPTAGEGTGYMSGSNRDTWRPTLSGAVKGYVPVLHQGRPKTPPSDRGGDSLLPTPAARDFRSGKSNIMDRNARPLNEVIEHLLPTPMAADGDRASSKFPRGNETLIGSLIPRGDHTKPPSADGKPSPDGPRPLPPSQGEPASGSHPGSSSG